MVAKLTLEAFLFGLTKLIRVRRVEVISICSLPRFLYQYPETQFVVPCFGTSKKKQREASCPFCQQWKKGNTTSKGKTTSKTIATVHGIQLQRIMAFQYDFMVFVSRTAQRQLKGSLRHWSEHGLAEPLVIHPLIFGMFATKIKAGMSFQERRVERSCLVFPLPPIK